MHETFVYCSHAQLLQVTFWHAYRDFFSNSATVEQLLSASEVIKNVTVAFPAAQAKLWTDERGETKFVISGMGFRKGTGEGIAAGFVADAIRRRGPLPLFLARLPETTRCHQSRPATRPHPKDALGRPPANLRMGRMSPLAVHPDAPSHPPAACSTTQRAAQDLSGTRH